MSTPTGAWVLARLIAGTPVDEQALDSLGEPWRELADVVVSANGSGRDTAFLESLAGRADADELKAAVFAVDPSAEPPAGQEATRERFRLMTVDEVTNQPDPDYLIEGHLVAGTVSVLYGPPGGGKTLEAIEEACCIASGLPWLGLERVRRGPVVMIAAEGVGGLGKRLRAWARRHPGADLSKLFIIGEAIDLPDPADVDALLGKLAGLPEKPVAIYDDTLARSMTGDENSTKDMGAFVRAVDRIRAETGAHLRILHHTGKSGELERGSSALRAAADTMTKLAEDGDTLVLTCDKQRDAEPFKKLRLKIVPVPEEGSVVLEWADRSEDGAIGDKERQALEALDQHAAAEHGLTATQWSAVSQLAERTFYRAVKRLTERGLVEGGTKRGSKFAFIQPGRDWIAANCQLPANSLPRQETAELRAVTATLPHSFRSGSVGSDMEQRSAGPDDRGSLDGEFGEGGLP